MKTRGEPRFATRLSVQPRSAGGWISGGSVRPWSEAAKVQNCSAPSPWLTSPVPAWRSSAPRVAQLVIARQASDISLQGAPSWFLGSSSGQQSMLAMTEDCACSIGHGSAACATPWVASPIRTPISNRAWNSALITRLIGSCHDGSQFGVASREVTADPRPIKCRAIGAPLRRGAGKANQHCSAGTPKCESRWPK